MWQYYTQSDFVITEKAHTDFSELNGSKYRLFCIMTEPFQA